MGFVLKRAVGGGSSHGLSVRLLHAHGHRVNPRGEGEGKISGFRGGGKGYETSEFAAFIITSQTGFFGRGTK